MDSVYPIAILLFIVVGLIWLVRYEYRDFYSIFEGIKNKPLKILVSSLGVVLVFIVYFFVYS